MFFRVTAFALICFIVSGFPASAADEQPGANKPPRIAVINFGANNTGEDIAKIIRNTVEMSFFSKGSFEMLERTQIELIVSERKNQLKECKDEKCAAAIGELLSSDYVVMGSVDKLDKYTINIQVVDVKTKTVVIVDTIDTVEMSGLRNSAEEISARVARKLEKKRLGIEKIDLSFSIGYVFSIPIGHLGGIASTGHGIRADAALENIFIKNFFLLAGLVYNRFPGRVENVDHSSMLPMFIGAGYRIPIWKLHLCPIAAAGASYNSLDYYAYFGKLGRTDRSKFQPFFMAGAGLEMSVTESILVKTDMEYCNFFEKGGSVSCISMMIGAGMRF
ncbi:MAG: CsgG/HfaB family protein [Spirochaetes bacterium]|jgi:TolB-like protein|nr:CsgG/HfaB family protein [Spirochaetota bacterium]